MRIVQKDLVSGSYARFSASNKIIVSRYHVGEMNGAHFAEAALCPGMPQQGEKHEKFPECVVTDVMPRPANATDQCYVDVTWESPVSANGGGGKPSGTMTLAFGTSVTQKLTQVDYQFKPMQTTWLPREKGLRAPIINTASAQIFWPRRSIVATGTIDGKPHAELFEHTGKTNAKPWQNGMERTWLYLGCEAATQDGGKTHSLRMSWLYEKLQWDEVFVQKNDDGKMTVATASAATRFVKPTKNIPEPDKIDGVSRYQVYDTADFDRDLKVIFE